MFNLFIWFCLFFVFSLTVVLPIVYVILCEKRYKEANKRTYEWYKWKGLEKAYIPLKKEWII